ncbi:MAG: oligoribonuclease [Frankiales bacterium]|jgi:oligoribonuclease|nr:oligoribonuclease [Frankiales bacterium]
MNDRLVWIDCEMTGLDLKNDVLLEIAALVTDSELNILDGGVDIVIHAGDDQLDRMIAFVRDMHAASGLTDDVRASAVTVEDAEAQVLAYIKTHVGEARKAPLCGNSIATDRGFLALQMPELETWLHYRMVDVSSVKELARRWYPRAYFASPEKNGGHRALADIRESIEELRYYRSTVFVPQPGPDSETAAKAAAAILAAREPAVAETGTA